MSLFHVKTIFRDDLKRDKNVTKQTEHIMQTCHF